MSISLRTSLAASFAALIILLSVAISVVAGRTSADRYQEEIGRSLAGIAHHMSDKLDYYMWSRSGEIDIMSSLDEFQHIDRTEPIRALLEKLKLTFPSFTWIGYLDPKGVVVASTGGLLQGTDISSRPVYLEALEDTFIGDVHDAKLLESLLPNPTGEPLQFVDISVPVRAQDGRLIGVLAAHLSWAWAKEVEETVLSSVQDYNDKLEIAIVSEKDHTVLLGPSGLVGKQLELESVQDAKKDGGAWRVESWPDGGEYVTGYAYGSGYMDYPGLGWTVLVREPAATAFTPAKEIRWSIWDIGAVSAILFGLVGWFLAGRIARPIQAIASAAERLGRGEGTSIPVHRGFKDIEILTTSLRDMVDNLTRTENALGRMEALALHDALTGLSNRIALGEYLDRGAELVRGSGNALAVLCLDLDGFKKVNDVHGHPAGDRLLQIVAERLTELVPTGGIAARLGGDEFVVAAPFAANSAEVEARALGERIIRAINVPMALDEATARVGCSVGAAIYPAHHSDLKEIMWLADQALYTSKRAGKNRVTAHGDA